MITKPFQALLTSQKMSNESLHKNVTGSMRHLVFTERRHNPVLVGIVRKNIDFKSVYCSFGNECVPWQTFFTRPFFFSRVAIVHPSKHSQMPSFSILILSVFLHLIFLPRGFGTHTSFLKEHPAFLHSFALNRVLQSSSYHAKVLHASLGFKHTCVLQGLVSNRAGHAIPPDTGS